MSPDTSAPSWRSAARSATSTPSPHSAAMSSLQSPRRACGAGVGVGVWVWRKGRQAKVYSWMLGNEHLLVVMVTDVHTGYGLWVVGECRRGAREGCTAG
eukprot:363254-Chlamydomonas_euryale.AAC.3